jgi:invasion protein IalB
MARQTPRLRAALSVFAIAAGVLALDAAAQAQQACGDDLKKLSEKREAELNKVNGLVKAAKGKPMDPALFCRQSAGLNSSESALIAYMEKNKDWCSIPDEVVNALKANHVKSVAFSAKACSVAAQMKKQQEAGGVGAPQAQPLPTGPL